MRVRLLATPDVSALGRIAITGTDVPTLRSTQLKGCIVASEPGNDLDAAKSRQYTDAFYSDVELSDRVPRRPVGPMTPTDFLALTVEVEEMFNQTPGPRAGSSLV